MGYDFTGGRIFDFPIDFSMGLTTVQRYCDACDHSLYGAVGRHRPMTSLLYSNRVYAGSKMSPYICEKSRMFHTNADDFSKEHELNIVYQ